MTARLPMVLALLSAAACGDDTGGDASSTSTGSDSTSTSTGTDTSDTESSGSSESSSTTGPMPCASDEECTDVTAPYCDGTGVCVACDQASLPADADAACATADPATPVCLAGTCVTCTPENPSACTGQTPICDDATNTCVPCTEHDQCGEAACNLYTGACLPGDAVVHVGAGQMYATITAAVDSFDVMTEGTIVVHAGPSYDESVTSTAAGCWHSWRRTATCRSGYRATEWPTRRSSR